MFNLVVACLSFGSFFLGLFFVVVLVVGGCSGNLGFEMYLGTGFEFLLG